MGTNAADSRKRSPGMVLVIMLIPMVAGSICMGKIASVLTNIVSDLAIANSTLSSMLMSILVISGIFLSIPMGMLTARCGAFKIGLFSLVAIIIGSSVGAVAGNYTLLLVSRMVEGIGLMFLAIISLAAVASSLLDKKYGTVTGSSMCFMPSGQIIALDLTSVMATSGTRRNSWWLSVRLGAVGMVLWVILIKGIDDGADGVAAQESSMGTIFGDVPANKGVWLVRITFFAYMIIHIGVFNHLPMYLTEVDGISATLAGTLTSVASLIGIPVGIVGGIIADKWGFKKKPLAMIMILFAILIGTTPMFNSSNFITLLVLCGIVAMAEAGLCFISVTEVVKANRGSPASAILNAAQWLGAFLSIMVLGTLLDSFGWSASFYVMVPIILAGAATALCNKDPKQGRILKMKDIITIATVNFDPVWGDSEDNLKRMLKHIEAQVKQGCDLIVFPETALTGYDDETGKPLKEKMHRRLVQTVPEPPTDAICELTKKYGIYVAYGLTERDAQDTSKVYNAAAVRGPDGVIGCYRKVHLPFAEQNWAVRGDTPMLSNSPWGTIGVGVCYDTYAYPEITRHVRVTGVRLFINCTTIGTSGSGSAGGYMGNCSLEYHAHTNDMSIVSSNTYGKDVTTYSMGGSSTIDLGSKPPHTFYYAGTPFEEEGVDKGIAAKATINPSIVKKSFLDGIWENPDRRPDLYVRWLDKVIEIGFLEKQRLLSEQSRHE